ncbi:MAG: GNAT family N-acetyltransferase [Thermodesulfobacteriota bacterium]
MPGGPDGEGAAGRRHLVQQLSVAKRIFTFKNIAILKMFRKVFNTLGIKFFKRSLIFSIKDLEKVPINFHGEYNFSVAKEEDLLNESDYDDRWYGREKALERIKKGHMLFIYREKGKIVYFHWVDVKEVNVEWFDLRFRIPSDMVYRTGLYVPPEYRRKGLAFKFREEITHYLKKQGFRFTLSVKNTKNTPVLELSKKSGDTAARQYQIVHYYRLWFIRWFRVEKINSNDHKNIIAINKTPEKIWNIFLPNGIISK